MQLETSQEQLDPPIISNKNPSEALGRPPGGGGASAAGGGRRDPVQGQAPTATARPSLGSSNLRLLAWLHGGCMDPTRP